MNIKHELLATLFVTFALVFGGMVWATTAPPAPAQTDVGIHVPTPADIATAIDDLGDAWKDLQAAYDAVEESGVAPKVKTDVENAMASLMAAWHAIAGGDAVTASVRESCASRCKDHCPPWKNPEKFSNCLASCAEGQGWACYTDPPPELDLSGSPGSRQ
ncbi:MAG: hypothetical protein OXI45_13645 [Acidobacteriota bacterium]|nr:hypothetical protein [Acidobacteriota bacterium]